MRNTPPVSALALTIAMVLWRPPVAEGQERRWLPEPVQSAVFADVDGVLFGSPQQIKATPEGGFVVTDWGDLTLRAFAATGDALWVSGGEGQGPGEFLGFWDLEYDAGGRLLVLDVRNRRVTVLDSAGSVQHTLTFFFDERVAQVLPFEWNGGHPVFLANDKSDGLWLAMDENGTVQRRGPTLSHSFENPLVSEAWAEPVSGGRAAVVFRWSDQMIFLDSDGRIEKTANGVEPIPFPTIVSYAPNLQSRGGVKITRVRRVDPAAPIAVRSAAAGLTRLFVLFEGATERSGRIVDTYALSDGAYMGSYLLPDPVDYITVLVDGRLATLDISFIPTVRLWSLLDG